MAKDYGKYFLKPDQKQARKRLKTAIEHHDYHAHFNVRHLGVGKHYLIQTYGCQGNEADTETMKGILEQLSFTETSEETEADIILLNTCAIRENAENRVFGELGRLKQFKKHNPDLILGVAGCMPQEESVTERLLQKYPYVDLIFGTHNIHKLPEYLETAVHQKERVVEVFSDQGSIIENLPKKRDHHTKAWVNIMFGCDEFCTYCVVPTTRGKERSRKPEHIIQEVEALAESGYKEVTLLGQNVNAYGKDLADSQTTFAALLSALQKTSIARVRFTTSHPKDFDAETIAVLASGKNLMPHIHLPVQSGSDSVLKRMNRHYTKSDYLNLIAAIKKAMPDVSLTTDIIVGFPGETDDDFEATLELVNTVGFEGAFTFIFSPRYQTPAASYQDDTPATVKHQRLQRLNQVINQGYLIGNQRFLNQTVDVLVEGPSKNNAMVFAGYTAHNKLVNFTGSQSMIGEIVPVRITEAKTWFLKGVTIEKT